MPATLRVGDTVSVYVFRRLQSGAV